MRPDAQGGSIHQGLYDNLLSLQVRAFLEASHEVDIDQETIEDLLQTITEQNDGGHHESNIELEFGEDDDAEGSLEGNPDSGNDELDVFALDNNSQELEELWTQQEVKQMLHHLKERGMSSFTKEYVLTRNIPILKLLLAFGVNLHPQLQNKRPSTMLYFLRVAMSHHLRMRDRLPQYNTISDAVRLIQSSQRIIILTGAGISVSCGIPDFRSRDGLYASLKNRGEYDLDDPQQMFDINYFKENPSVFYSFASQIYPSNFTPSPCHRFIKLIEDKGKLLRNYTQNIDTLETLAGVKQVLQCHGSFATATCLQCHRRVPGTDIERDILSQKVPLCIDCNPPASKNEVSRKKVKDKWDSDAEDESDGPLYPPGIMKPDITFFGEKLTNDFDLALLKDRDAVDLLLVVGTSLKVSPVAEILSHLPHSIPQILINKTPIRHINPDIVLLGNADEIVEHICRELGWDLPLHKPAGNGCSPLNASIGNTRKRSSSNVTEFVPQRVGGSHVWLFNGAEGGKWLDDLQKTFVKSETSASSTSSSSAEITSEGDSTRESKKQKIN